MQEEAFERKDLGTRCWHARTSSLSLAGRQHLDLPVIAKKSGRASNESLSLYALEGFLLHLATLKGVTWEWRRPRSYVASQARKFTLAGRDASGGGVRSDQVPDHSVSVVLPRLSGMRSVSYTHLTLPTNREV